MNDKDIENEIVAKGLTAPRVTPADVESEILSENYFTALDGVFGDSQTVLEVHNPLSLLTFCVLVLRNSFTVTGESACASPENFNAEIGRKIAREKAIAKIWPLLGFRLRDKLSGTCR
jgi:Phage protein (N4 Gp49/phage Sf6 gene 66) family